MRRALGIPQAGETTEQLDRIGERDRAKAERGLVPIMGWGDVITYEHLDELSRLNMKSRTTAEWVTVKWLRERLECAKKRASAPPVPKHLRD
jgi:hypothetical protein